MEQQQNKSRFGKLKFSLGGEFKLYEGQIWVKKNSFIILEQNSRRLHIVPKSRGVVSFILLAGEEEEVVREND